ncbi:branched-chain amino acid ABC transporter permease [Effusibacillus lacus]|uniref:Branched-chain amino acid ABC transporter permease n=1 Tax=Effusibacillus lacus TaxID=1348429 RepID=A0A292YCD8_9BACL|nr:branched-chain amino acid ABC transporter permease [Effusibacillus lacus]TCS75550.1 branched-chain amino acid transport system permease protein [Effusibacillus lacus]GAX89012.1 branched-chain amino acid ABC transporter permease [Effusibacillus lacus]
MNRLLTKGNILLILGVLFLFMVPQFGLNKFYMHIVILILFYAAVSGSWNILAGYAGQLSLGHAIFFGLGAYTSTLLLMKSGISPWIGMLVAVGLCLLVGALIGYPCFRLKGPFFTLATLAFSEVIRLVASFWKELTNGAVGLNIPFQPGWSTMMFRSKEPYFYIALVILLLVIAITYWIDRSKMGSYLVAIREDEEAAESLGIPISRYKMYAVLISSGLAGMTGVFYAQYILFIDPEAVFNINFSVQVALISIIGGMGTVLGPLIGAVLMIPLNEILRSAFSGLNGLNFFIYGFVLILVVSLIPNGILPTVRNWLKKATAKKKGTRQVVANPRNGGEQVDSAN